MNRYVQVTYIIDGWSFCMKRILNYSIVLFVLTIILLLIIPLPPAFVDVAIIINMSLSMMILVITMTIREPLELSIFPSLLLYYDYRKHLSLLSDAEAENRSE